MKLQLFDPLSSSVLTVEGIISAYLAHLEGRVEAGDYSSDAFDNSRRDLLRFSAHFGHQSHSSCQKTDPTEWLRVNPQWRSNHTKRRALAALLACFRWATDEAEMIPFPPTENLRSFGCRFGRAARAGQRSTSAS